MRILHLVPNLNFGGLQKVVQLLAFHQTRAGHAVTIASWANFNNNPVGQRQLEEAGINLVFPRRQQDGSVAKNKKELTMRLKALMGEGRADILHIHNPFHYYLFGVVAARLAGHTKSVQSVHLTMTFDMPTFGFGKRGRFLTAALLSNGIISVCQDVEDYLLRRFRLPGVKMFVVENGVDLAAFLAAPERVTREEVVFGFAGRMAIEKNHRGLIEAFALARKKHGNIRLRLLGGGELEPELKEQVRALGLEQVVEFCGLSNNVPPFLGSLDVYILPSTFEAHPLSLIEAIASGLPVVATAVGGVPKMVNETQCGWLCEPGNPQALTSAMELAIAAVTAEGTARAELEARTRRAREIAGRLYSAERMAADHEVVYRKLLGQA